MTVQDGRNPGDVLAEEAAAAAAEAKAAEAAERKARRKAKAADEPAEADGSA